MNFICKEIQHHSYGVVGGTLKINSITQEKFVPGKNRRTLRMKEYHNTTMM
jgi:hypothetical protein